MITTHSVSFPFSRNNWLQRHYHLEKSTLIIIFNDIKLNSTQVPDIKGLLSENVGSMFSLALREMKKEKGTIHKHNVKYANI